MALCDDHAQEHTHPQERAGKSPSEIPDRNKLRRVSFEAPTKVPKGPIYGPVQEEGSGDDLDDDDDYNRMEYYEIHDDKNNPELTNK